MLRSLLGPLIVGNYRSGICSGSIGIRDLWERKWKLLCYLEFIGFTEGVREGYIYICITHISRSRPRSRDPEHLELRSRPLHSRPTNAISQADFVQGVRSISVPDKAKDLAHTHPVSLVGTSKSQSSFQTLRIKCAIQTLPIRQHRNVPVGHLVLSSSHLVLRSAFPASRPPMVSPPHAPGMLQQRQQLQGWGPSGSPSF